MLQRSRTRHTLPSLTLIAACVALRAFAAPPGTLEEIVVTGQLREKPVDSVAASVSVLSMQRILARQATHFDELLNAAPNVNFNGGASRGRFVQIRGIGERDQYVDPVDNSVGLYIDGIDFSGLGNAGTLFDVEQVEVLRGPQGTAFGASAMAGMINIRSAAPAEKLEAYAQGRLAEYGGRNLGAVLSGPLGDNTGARLAMESNRSDGYIRNSFLQRDDTAAIDEATARLRLAWQATPDLAFDLSALHVRADNGYDAWSLDNNRHTLSDQPGQDKQRSDALALRTRWDGADAFSVDAVATVSNSDLDYGYDEDWTYPDICTGQPCDGWQYATTDRYVRDVHAGSLDLRLVGNPDAALPWVAGVYAARRDTSLDRHFFDWSAGFPPPPTRAASDYRSTRLAAYAEVSRDIGARVSVTGGLRVERYDADYDDSYGTRAEPGQTLWGGHLSAQFALSDDAMLYAEVSRGYKPGGVNGDAIAKAQHSNFSPAFLASLAEQLEFRSESLVSYEAGYKAAFAGGAAHLRAAVFYMDRRDVQLKTWYNEGPQFVGFTGNAASGSNKGVELEGDWQAAQRLRLGASLGLLRTEIENYAVYDAVLGALVDRSGRDQAQAPRWQFHLDAELALWARTYARVELEGKDSYYFSDSNDQRTDAFRLLHLSAGYRGQHLEASAWVRNVLNQRYSVEGFRFGNDPRKFFVEESYYQYGEPRVAGITLRYML